MADETTTTIGKGYDILDTAEFYLDTYWQELLVFILLVLVFIAIYRKVLK